MRIRTQCRDCGLPFNAEIEHSTAELACPGCDSVRELVDHAWNEPPEGRVQLCPICGCKHLYRQRDFNRALGCGLVAVGAVFVPWTYGLSLIVLSLFDLWLYRRLPLAVVCYRCDTVFRDARPIDRQGEFDLLKHDVLKYGKSWEEAEGQGQG